jgi:hypothetical protein
LPFPTKQPPRLREVVINRITKAIFFMKAPRLMLINWIATKSWLIKCKLKPGTKLRDFGATPLMAMCCPLRARTEGIPSKRKPGMQLKAKRLQNFASVFDGAAVFSGPA